MGSRRRSRVLAMQVLFDIDMSPEGHEEKFEQFCKNFKPSERALPFLQKLVTGVSASRDEIDLLINEHSSNWKISRMSAVDRNIMRIAVYELLYCLDIPSKVTINEAVDIGKKFGTVESGAFINGILDSINMAIEGKDASAENDLIPTTD
ncbi:MAG: transcription antitermination factor NusB [Desulfobacterales bacterium]|nr:transcription antitermination factor NusB [Desulfobacterales bacterium]